MTTIIDALGTSEGIAAVVLLILGLAGIVLYALKVRNAYLLILSIVAISVGAILLGIATDVIDIVWNGWKTPAPVVPTPDVPTPSG